MSDPSLQWHRPSAQPPDWFVQAVQRAAPEVVGRYLAPLLWQRGIRDPDQLVGFLNPDVYQPSSPFAFGAEMQQAVDRLRQAYTHQETVAIWGDFDADGVTATAVLWDGLGQFFMPQKTLLYYIPNRLTESHGLSRQGLDDLHARGCHLIVTCDTGSTNLDELAYAQTLGMDVIVTDHHTLPSTRPPVVAIVNPRFLPEAHPLASLSGVAVAYKLVEALYETLPDVPQKPLTALLDLVAIGLIADLVELKGDSRYLAQKGIAQLQTQANPATATRPGVQRLLELCKRCGDRPTDISFGLGPRINAVSRIQGDAHFCVELLTSQDVALCNQLAEATELANTRRKALQKEVAQQVNDRLAQLDLSTTSVIVLADAQWPLGVLGLVAGQMAQTYGRPTILLTTEGIPITAIGETAPFALARGSARSANAIDLYQLVKGQEHLLHRFGGHPYAAGLSLPIANLPLFTEAINQQLRQVPGFAESPTPENDLEVTVADLGKPLFQALKLLEPCGMGNPTPKLLIGNVWFERVRNRNIKDWKGGKVRYIKTEFVLRDDTTTAGFPGVWWEHYQDEIPKGRCDAIVELDFNTYQKRYEVRLIAVRPQAATVSQTSNSLRSDWILDWRDRSPAPTAAFDPPPLVMAQCPTTWTELQAWVRRSQQTQRPLAIAYPSPLQVPPQDIWQQLVGIAKYLNRTGQTATRAQLLDKLGIGDRTLKLGFAALEPLGFTIRPQGNALQITWSTPDLASATDQDAPSIAAIDAFLVAVNEEQFRRQYFYQLPLATLQSIATQITPDE